MDITPIIEAVITLIVTIITTAIVPYIKKKYSVAQLQEIQMWVAVAVNAAEQLYKGEGRGIEKKQYVVAFLENKGLKIDPDALDKLIESAVYEIQEAGR